MKKSIKDMYTCPMCHAMMYPLIEEDEGSELGKKYSCVSCKEDMTPYIEAYMEYIVKSGEARLKKEDEVL